MTTYKLQLHVEKRLRAWFDLASAAERAEGRTWYNNVNAFIEEVSVATGLSLPRVAGVVAALSPSVYWAANRRQAEALCRAYADGEDLAAVVLTTYGRQAAKAREILTASRIEDENPQRSGYAIIRGILGKRAFKTGAFFDNILDPDDVAGLVTVDQHIIAAAGMGDFYVQGARWCYNLIANAIRKLAHDHGYLPQQMQAIIWLAYKAERAERQQAEELPF